VGMCIALHSKCSYTTRLRCDTGCQVDLCIVDLLNEYLFFGSSLNTCHVFHFAIDICTICDLSTTEEYDPAMMRCLEHVLPSTACKYSDILEVFQDPADSCARLLAEPDYDSKLALYKTLPTNTSGSCKTHGGVCPFQKHQSLLRVQGPPCPDWSTANTKGADHKGLKGPRLPTLFAAAAKARVAGSTMTVVENVKGMPLYLLEDAYSPTTTWIERTLCPGMTGFGYIARLRTSGVEQLSCK
jgi:hypothetical protein